MRFCPKGSAIRDGAFRANTVRVSVCLLAENPCVQIFPCGHRLNEPRKRLPIPYCSRLSQCAVFSLVYSLSSLWQRLLLP